MLSLRENMELVYDHKEPAYLPLMEDFDTAVLDAMDFVNERPNIPGVNKDWFGQSWTYEANTKAGNPTPGCCLVTDITRWKEQMLFPDLDKLDWEGRSRSQTAGWDRENRMSKITLGFGMWERLFSVMPFDEALIALVEEPDACYEFFQAVADHKIRLHEKVIQYYRPDVIVMHDDYGTSAGMFMAPETWRELLKPHLQRIVDHIQNHGVIYEHHNCGYFVPIMEDMIEMGIGATNPLHVSNDITYMKEKYGDKMVFLGGFDNQLIDSPVTSEEEVRANVRETMDILAPGGGFIPRYTGIGQNTPILMDEVRKYGKNFYGPRPKEN